MLILYLAMVKLVAYSTSRNHHSSFSRVTRPVYTRLPPSVSKVNFYKLHVYKSVEATRKLLAYMTVLL